MVPYLHQLSTGHGAIRDKFSLYFVHIWHHNFKNYAETAPTNDAICDELQKKEYKTHNI